MQLPSAALRGALLLRATNIDQLGALGGRRRAMLKDIYVGHGNNKRRYTLHRGTHASNCCTRPMSQGVCLLARGSITHLFKDCSKAKRLADKKIVEV